MTYEERNVWWDAYCSALSTWVQHATADRADKYSAESADLALARWRTIRLIDDPTPAQAEVGK